MYNFSCSLCEFLEALNIRPDLTLRNKSFLIVSINVQLSSLLWVVFFIAIPGKRFVWVNGSSKILEKEIEPNCVYVLSLHKWMFFKLWSKLLSVELATFFKATYEWNSDIFITTGPGFILIGYFYNHRARFLRHLTVRSFFG